MNNYAKSIVLTFSSEENRIKLYNNLMTYYATRGIRSTVEPYLQSSLNTSIDHFCTVIEREMNMSDPLPGITRYDQITCYNNQFLQSQCDFIQTHVLGDENMPKYIINDGLPTSRRGLQHHQQSADHILKTWLANSGRGVQAREDSAGDVSGSAMGSALVKQKFTSANATGNSNPYYGMGDEHMNTGIVFCDQTDLGTSNHVEQYEDTVYKQALNRCYAPHEAIAFGVATMESDDRLLSRRTFRSNEVGEENGIPRYERRLYGRNYERKIDDTLHNAEKDYKLSGHDMTSLYRRIDQKNMTKNYYAPRCDQYNQLHIENNNFKHY